MVHNATTVHGPKQWLEDSVQSHLALDISESSHVNPVAKREASHSPMQKAQQMLPPSALLS